MTTNEPSRRRPPPSERRARAIDAFVDLCLEGASPKPEEVAERADLGIATLYRYFATLDELRHEAMTRVLERFPELFTIPCIGEGDRDDRINSLVRTRLDLHETLHRIELLHRSRAFTDAGAAAAINDTRQVLADQVRQHFEPELHTLTPAVRTSLVATIEVITSVESWVAHRESHAHSRAQTDRAWTFALDQLLPGS